MQEETTGSSRTESEVADLAGEDQTGILREFWDFLRTNKKWWLLPILAVLLLTGVLVFLAGTVAAPFIYPLF